MKAKAVIFLCCTMVMISSLWAAPAAPKAVPAKKILVVYYSKTGNTERVAKDIAVKLNADLEKIEDQKARQGFFNTLAAAKDALKKNQTEIAAPTKQASAYQLVIVGTPTWMGHITPAVRTYLSKNAGQFKKFAFFTTAGNTGPEKLAAEIEAVSGTKAIAFTGFNSKALKDSALYDEKMTPFIDAVKAAK